MTSMTTTIRMMAMSNAIPHISLDQDVNALATKVKHNMVLANQMMATMSRV